MEAYSYLEDPAELNKLTGFVDPNLQPHERESFFHVLWEKNKVKFAVSDRKLITGLLRHDYADYKNIRCCEIDGDLKPVGVSGIIPLGCLRIKSKKREYQKKVI